MAMARKNAGPIELTAEKGLMEGCANSLRNTFQLKPGSEIPEIHQLNRTISPKKKKKNNP